MSDLESATGTPPPDEFVRLDPDQHAHLADLVESAARRRSEALGQAIDESLRHIPALLRGPVRRSLGL
ncbi:MAG TPA: hypothetical protein VGN18_17280 [Jatrophihabitans sp.]|jgi:hypothetical protein|uniref:hypothetical protein n=1 Tax=Jatrophihabitans sp. TaxID=1932789 RepID=UPI002E07AA1F|nr:hypothetical protein [Jatrophihabitans sp.]